MKHLQKWNLIAIAAVLCVTLGAGKPRKTLDNFVPIPGGKILYNHIPVEVKGFTMQATEVTNEQYRTFLHDLKKQGTTKDYYDALPDTTQWRKQVAYSEPYVAYYFRHPAYNNYPVVNISKKGVALYCQWLSQKVNREEGKKVTFRLPTAHEWMLAAQGGKNSLFPWEGKSLQNKKGQYRCNFRQIPQKALCNTGDELKVMQKENAETTSTIMAPVNSYYPNEYGLYCMSGNAAEMTADNGILMGGSWHDTGYFMRLDADYSLVDYTSPSPFVGFRVVAKVQE